MYRCCGLSLRPGDPIFDGSGSWYCAILFSVNQNIFCSFQPSTRLEFLQCKVKEGEGHHYKCSRLLALVDTATW
jgi:hypothetical protein